jgi:glycosyltransferase involved in cell wall biosynthesis
MSDVRVLQVVLSLNPGGTERLVLELAARLHAELPTAVCCLDDAGAWAGDLETRGIHVTALGRRSGFRPGLALGVARAASAHRATVIHAHHYSPFVYAGLARALRPGLRLVFTEHGRLSDAPPSTRRRAANRALSRLPHEVFTVSEDLRRHILAEGFPPESVSVIYNGIDVGPRPSAELRAEVRRSLGFTDRSFVIGTIARLDPVKDLATLVRAMATLDLDRPAELLVVGDGPERSALEAVAAEAGVGERIHFLGHRDDARRLLAACDTYVNSSISEGVSLTILEAMAAGLPIVATRVGGTPEVVDDASGRLVEPRDPRAIATAVAGLAAEPAIARALGDNARRRVETRFTLDRMVREYAAAYREEA